MRSDAHRHRAVAAIRGAPLGLFAFGGLRAGLFLPRRSLRLGSMRKSPARVARSTGLRCGLKAGLEQKGLELLELKVGGRRRFRLS